MSYPAGVNLVPVVAGANGYFYRDGTGSKVSGDRARVVFVALSGAVVLDGISLPTKLVATLDAAGQVPDTFKLPTCNDAAREIGGIYYRVTEDFPGGRDPYTIFVASDATLVDLADAEVVVPPTDLESARGAPGNTLFATFDIDPATGHLSVTTPVGFAGISFAIDSDGYLGVSIQ